jgi:hypothetical protein
MKASGNTKFLSQNTPSWFRHPDQRSHVDPPKALYAPDPTPHILNRRERRALAANKRPIGKKGIQ